MYSSFYDLEASSHVATIRQLHQVLEANLHVLEEVCVRITMTKDNLDQIINNLKYFRPKISEFNSNRKGDEKGDDSIFHFSIIEMLSYPPFSKGQ